MGERKETKLKNKQTKKRKKKEINNEWSNQWGKNKRQKLNKKKQTFEWEFFFF